MESALTKALQKGGFVARSSSQSIHFNLALENWIHSIAPIKPSFFWWRNKPSVIIGRHQNAWGELAVPAIIEDKIDVARRFSGGGAVFHDLGNSCYTFFLRRDKFDFQRQLKCILRGVSDGLHVEGRLGGRNDLVLDVDGELRKFSGSAFQHRRLRCANATEEELMQESNVASLHHGTVLLAASPLSFDRYLTPKKEKLAAKGVKSVHTRIVNLRDCCPDPEVANHDALFPFMKNAFEEYYGAADTVIDLGPEVKELVNNPEFEDAHTLLASWDWQFGKSPAVEQVLNISKRFENIGIFEVSIGAVEEGLMRDVRVYSDALDPSLAPALQSCLESAKFDMKAIREATSGNTELQQLGEWVAEAIAQRLDATD